MNGCGTMHSNGVRVYPIGKVVEGVSVVTHAPRALHLLAQAPHPCLKAFLYKRGHLAHARAPCRLASHNKQLPEKVPCPILSPSRNCQKRRKKGEVSGRRSSCCNLYLLACALQNKFIEKGCGGGLCRACLHQGVNQGRICKRVAALEHAGKKKKR